MASEELIFFLNIFRKFSLSVAMTTNQIQGFRQKGDGSKYIFVKRLSKYLQLDGN